MKRFLLSVICIGALLLPSCKFDDSDIWDKFGEMEESIRDHEQRISALEELCKQMNTNIEALQTLVSALEKRDYITNISQIREDGKIVGYTISFAYSDTITIYHGQNGKDGANGKDGYTPQIGVMKDVDGIYYWTLDGEWLLDGKGNKIQANGVNGTNGSNGTNGTNGVDGITPRLKIENDYWFVSYDNGETWQQLGKATGEDGTDGNDGIDGEDGDSIFKSVTQDDEYVYFNLSDGTMITLPKHDKENIQFEDLQVKAICCKNWDTNNDGELSYAEAAAVTDIGDTFSRNTNIIAFTEFKYFTGITAIPGDAFYKCTSLWKIVLPQNVETLYSGSFGECINLTSINIPKKVKSITYNNSNFPWIKSVYIEDLEAWCHIDFDSTSANPLTNGADLYMDGKIVTELVIPTNITKIKDCAFYCCKSLTKVVISDGVTTIGSGAFNGCENLETIIIGKGVKSIQDSFWYCPWLRYIYCECTTPPGLAFRRDNGEVYGGSFPFNTGMRIYVPRSFYNSYMQFTNTTNTDVSTPTYQNNWYAYESYIQPYDFE